MSTGQPVIVELSLTLCLPREASSVPISRRVAADLLRSIGFLPDDVADIELALTEACSNVLRHSLSGDEYEVHVHVDKKQVVIEVEDKGPGFPADMQDRAARSVDAEAESGRGLQLMRALVDELKFDRADGDRSVVRMVRAMRVDPDSKAAEILLAQG